MVLSDKQKNLLALLADGQFHSGNDLAKALNLSRSAVWKHLQGCIELGIEVHALNGKGYRLDKPLMLLSKAEIQSRLNPSVKSLLSKLDVFDQLDSTNNYLMLQARRTNESGQVCLAEYQSSGKGRRGRQWVSPFASNIYLSILWRFNQTISALGGLSLVVGVAVIRALNQLGIADVGLKWPNDIFWQQKKLGGILIEIIGESEGPCCAVIGLGLNVRMSDKVMHAINQPWVDLEHILGHSNTDRNVFVAALLNEIVMILNAFNPQSLQANLDEWRQYDCMRNQVVTLFMQGQAIHGIVQGINQEGLLILMTQSGDMKAFASGELSFSSEGYEATA